MCVVQNVCYNVTPRTLSHGLNCNSHISGYDSVTEPLICTNKTAVQYQLLCSTHHISSCHSVMNATASAIRGWWQLANIKGQEVPLSDLYCFHINQLFNSFPNSISYDCCLVAFEQHWMPAQHDEWVEQTNIMLAHSWRAKWCLLPFGSPWKQPNTQPALSSVLNAAYCSPCVTATWTFCLNMWKTKHNKEIN